MQVYDKIKKKDVIWTPSNANGYFTGDSMSLKSAFARSVNSIAVRLGQQMGIDRIIETAQKMGIKSPLDNTPSLALGSSDVNLLEMVDAYSTIADDGMHHDPVIITKIVDKDGNEVFVGNDNPKQAVPYKTAFLVQQLLLGGLTEPGGTSMSLWGYVGPFKDTQWGGKTGTSNNHSDAWYMAVSPKLVCGAWVGGEYRCIHFRTGALGQGSRTALPICGLFLQSLLQDPAFQKYHAKFGKPKDADITSSMYTCASYVPHAKRDTVRRDTTMNSIMDEEGNPVVTPLERPEKDKEKTAPTPQRHHVQEEQQVTLDNI